MEKWKNDIDKANMLVARLERLSADSIWAHRASGLRGSLLRQLNLVENQGTIPSKELFDPLEKSIEQAYTILAYAAKEIPDPDQMRSRLEMD